jgi:acetyl esterase/lipase
MKNFLKYYYADDKPRDCVLVLPGGGYSYTSEREGEPVAKLFNKKGYHAIVYNYREEGLFYDALIQEAKNNLLTITKNKKFLRLHIIGFSAGGHFALALGIEFYKIIDSILLIYPVITSGIYGHQDSFKNILGKEYINRKDELSLENKVHKKMPRTFIMHTSDDELVDVRGSYLLALKYKELGLKLDLHVYESGAHGLSIIEESTVFDGWSVKQYMQKNKRVKSYLDLLFAFLED